MKKISGKALSLVLSLALVVSSFSVSLASAATSESGTVTLNQDTVYFSNGGTVGTSDAADVINFLSGAGVKSFASASGATVTTSNVKDVALTSNSSLATLTVTKDSDGNVTNAVVKLNDVTKTGVIGLSARYVGSYTKADGTAVAVNAVAPFKIVVYQAGMTVIGGTTAAAAAITDGTKPADLSKLAKSGTDSIKGAVYVLAPGAATALAAWEPQVLNVAPADIAINGTAAVGNYYVSNSNTNTDLALDSTDSTKKTFTLTTKGASAQTLVAQSSVTLTATKVATAPTASAAAVLSSSSIEKATAATAVENRIKTAFAYIGGSNGHVYIADNQADITAGTTGTTRTLIDGVTVESSANSIYVINGTVAKLVATDAAAAVNVTTGSISEISGAKNVTVSNGSVGVVSKVVDAGIVTVNGGKVGTITPADSADITVNVIAIADKISAAAGSVTAKTLTVGSSSAKSASVVTSAKVAVATVDGAKASLGTIDANKDVVAVTYSDDYVGAAVPVTNINSDKLPAITVDADAEISYSDAATLGVLTVNGKVTFNNTASIAGANGAGTIVFVPGKLYTTDALSGVTMEVLGGKITAGMTLFTAPSYTVYEGSFTAKGYTVAKVSGDKVDTFKVDQPTFYGIVLNKTSDKIAVGYSATYTASAYPVGTSLPEGATIKFTFTGSEDYFSFTDNNNGTATVKALKYDSVFSDLNKGSVKATLYDQYGVQMYQYTEPVCDLTVIEKPEVTFKSDTTGDVKMNVGGTYQFKITSLDGTVPPFGLGGNGAAVTSSSVSGKDYFYKVTANKAGDYGVYVNGTRVAILRVTAASAKIDTTVVTIKVGNTYQFKVTSAAKPAFGLGSSALQTVATSSKGQDYFYKVKAVSGKTGDKVGVYVNGTRAAIATIG